MYRTFGKRLFDGSGALLLLLLFFPFIAVVGLVVRLRLGAPVFFKQERPGMKGKVFPLIKFRTMRDARDSNGVILPDKERLTRLGYLLRATSLDELPELWNVIKGEMSLVGPRPLLPRYLERYTPDQARRHEVRPGITGWAQVNGRNAISWEEKFRLDVWYVDNLSFWLDLKILWLTVWKVLRRDEISAEGEATMPEFMGAEGGGAEGGGAEIKDRKSNPDCSESFRKDSTG